ncbi:MAG: DNA primase [Sulfurospirillum sp.]|nr:MAG: DNA primase [Sulfurospirillum sp.]
MIEQESIEALKNRLDIVDVVGSYIELKKSGANFKANCPFHGENTPSFVVSPAKQIYKCFGCGVGGDSIKFVMEYEKLSYPEALEKLASQYNITLRHTEGNKSFSKEKKIMEDLNLFFRKNLSNNPTALHYLHERGIYESSIEKFEIGYAPESFKSLEYMRDKGVSFTDAKDFGLVAVDEKGRAYARFTQRITFPIFTPAGKIVGFGGRTITNHPAKYINSPQSKIFDKSHLLYGYHKAKTTILQKGEIIITEGYLDVIMLHQAGFTNTVATLGTALTNYHVPIIARGDPKVILAYDGDKAGRAAAFKAASMLSAKGMGGGVVLFGEGMDPADMVKARKTDELSTMFRKPKPLIEFCIEEIVARHNTSDPLQKERALKEVTEYLKTLSPVLQDEYKGYVAAILGVNERLVGIRHERYMEREQQQTGQRRREDIAELSMIKTILSNPSVLDRFFDVVGDEVFQVHRYEFSLVAQEQFDHPDLLGIMIRDDILELDEESLKKQLRLFLIKHYNEALRIVGRNRAIPAEKKNFLLRKIKENLQKLKRGELVAYESFSTI